MILGFRVLHRDFKRHRAKVHGTCTTYMIVELDYKPRIESEMVLKCLCLLL